MLSRLVAGMALIAGSLAFAWAWQLQGHLDQAQGELQDYADRIGDLEARLSDTDEGMSQSAAVQAVKIAELDTEVRKLWDNVWKKAGERLDKLEAASAAHGKSVAGLEGSLASTRAQLEKTTAEIAQLKTVGGDLARLMSSAKASQAEVERVSDSLNRIELSMAKLEKRVAGNEEWVGSVNAFRRQVNASLGELQAAVHSHQAGP
jgi:chromosome segregation ATPase